MSKKRRPKAHVCAVPGCKRITLRTHCERCTTAALLRKIAGPARACG